ncbi:3',5'-cyclic-nucleotide phosphodiesterase [Panacibacter ginsenosidivorans]|uniref:3',5'-cyclic-nucleotide phosphodiesterase n=1 Tax=Panacibacter ginsenosidivorans TaxID=1813871 RepID=A0A5B8V603_9BACT|nr:3',5'-cyclic-nucleotide phosphodiesterase [Panacibacter ginsenosidivorans]QEC66917.1 3',5'-cyclic-nucleotide phosphodiesterase [Panacibacter ginsenosidivorans]
MRSFITLLISLALCNISFCQHSFKVVPLGVKGGIDESNLSAYMLAVNGTDDYVCLDAGTLHAGIQKSIDAGIFKNVSANDVLKRYIKGYCISHAHLDHLSGLIINSPDDTVKNIYGMPYCLDVLRNNYFTWRSWANFADDGEKPTLNKYHYLPLEEGKEIPIPQTNLHITAYPLSHSSPYQSTAFLVRYEDAYFLYLGDTGADTTEHSDKLKSVWQHIAPLVIAKKLKAVFIEVSYTDAQPLNKLFGHLTPSLLMNEMNVLSALAGTDNMKPLPIAITHIKPSGSNQIIIRQQLEQLNTLHLKLVYPEQAKLLLF